MMMFCGLPVIVATEPMFEAVARPTRYGIGGRFRRWQRWSTSGVNATQTTSLTRNAESTPEMAIVTASSVNGPEKRAAIRFRRQCEEAGQAEVGHDHHHAEEQDNRFIIDGPGRVAHREHTAGRAWRPHRPGRSPRGRSAGREPCQRPGPDRSGRRSSKPRESRPDASSRAIVPPWGHEARATRCQCVHHGTIDSSDVAAMGRWPRLREALRTLIQRLRDKQNNDRAVATAPRAASAANRPR